MRFIPADLKRARTRLCPLLKFHSGEKRNAHAPNVTVITRYRGFFSLLNLMKNCSYQNKSSRLKTQRNILTIEAAPLLFWYFEKSIENGRHFEKPSQHR